MSRPKRERSRVRELQGVVGCQTAMVTAVCVAVPVPVGDPSEAQAHRLSRGPP